ncbi:MAG: D-aminoacyl-tRNA deacylase [Desulfurococcaceae archaeon]
MLALVYSTRDPAGVGIVNYVVSALGLRENCTCRYCVECYVGESIQVAGFNADVVHLDFLDEVWPCGVALYIVASRHSSEVGIKSYTVHFTGNYGFEAIMGGRPRELGIAHPQLAWYMLREISEVAINRGRKEEYEVSYEASHHGPTNLGKPIVFVEIGSTPDDWKDPLNHEIVGYALYRLLREYPNLPDCTSVIGIGGGHYPRKHTEIALNTSMCYGHILPKYALMYLSMDTLNAMYARTAIRPLKIIVEKKSTRQDHRRIIEEFAKEHSMEVQYI